MRTITIPEHYSPALDAYDTQRAIAYIKQTFQQEFSSALNLKRVSAPLFVTEDSGLNDNLNGFERPVSFDIPAVQKDAQVVHSLAKWKRLALKRYHFTVGNGLYTDMNAIRRDEELDNIHSIYVDQWDWCAAITEENRNVMYLKQTVRKIYDCLKRTEFFIYDRYDMIEPILPEQIHFVFADDLQKMYPDLTPKERENKICQEYGAVFLIGIGGKLPDGTIHDGRAPDYDDWITETGDGHRGLNGDLLVWNPVLKNSYELSSMGIRVSPESLKAQLEERGCLERSKLEFHRRLLAGELAQTMGGGIGQSRLCMFFLRKAHIGETQVSIWPEQMKKDCVEHGIFLL